MMVEVVEPQVLQKLRAFPLTDRLRVVARVGKKKAFEDQVAFVVNRLRVFTCDIMYMCLQRRGAEVVHSRHQETVQMFDLLLQLCKEPTMLMAWLYTPDRQQWLVQRLGPVVGAGRRFVPVQAEKWKAMTEAGTLEGIHTGGALEDAPFLCPVLCAFISEKFRLMPLAWMLAGAAKGRWEVNDTVFVADAQHSGRTRFGEWWQVSSGVLPGMGTVSIVCQGSEVVSVHFARRWPKQERPSGRQFLPVACRIPRLDPANNMCHLLDVPNSDIAYLAMGKPAWERRLGRLAPELEVLLDGNFCISRSEQWWTPTFQRNHPSWDAAAEEALWPTIAKWLWKGILEYVSRHCRLPMCILACGAVPKSTAPWFRLITDFRPTNKFVDAWPVKYISLKGMSLVLVRNAIFWWRDLDCAYLQNLLGGCGRPWVRILRWIVSQDGKSYRPMESRCYGCDPASCGGACDKAMSGVCMSGHVMRFAGPQFGGKTSHGPLAVVTDEFIRYIMRMIQIFGAAYVDDMLFALLCAWHGPCAGLRGGCVLCLENLTKAQVHEKWIDEVMVDLHLNCSLKRGVPGQRDVFMGVIFDTVLGRMLLTEEKLAKLMAGLASLLVWADASPRDMAKLRGKLISYSLCIQRIRPFIIPFTKFIGSPANNGEWDARSGALESVKDNTRYLIQWLPSLAALGAPLWDLETTTLYEHWMEGKTAGLKIIVATWDAAIPGTAMVFREAPDRIQHCVGRQFENLSTVATFPSELLQGLSLEHQVHREGWGGVLTVKTLLENDAVHDCVVILRNDCAPALAALEKGSSRSPELQAAAVELLKLCIPRGIFPRCLHTSGEELIKEGVDDGSRAKARALQGPACSIGLRARLVRFAAKQGWALTVDFFASACNHVTDRYMSWTNDPECEQVDAFAARSWNLSRCPGCMGMHRETGFFFPPSGLEDKVVRRARSDGARGVFLVPCSRKAPFFAALKAHALASSEVAVEADVFTHLSRPMCKHMLFAVDFGGADQGVGGCGQEALRRPRERWVRPIEADESEAILNKLRDMATQPR